MANVSVYNMEGKEVGTIELNDAVFGVDMGPGGPGMQGDNQGGPGGPGNEKFSGTTSINKVDDINAVVDFTVLGQLLALGLALTIIGSLAACVAIARFSPLEILRERS